MFFSDNFGLEDTAESQEPFLKKQASRPPHNSRSEKILRFLLYAAGFTILGLSACVAALSYRLSQCNVKETGTETVYCKAPFDSVPLSL